MTPFDFINSITYNKKDLLKEEPPAVKDYVPFVVNRGLSYFADTTMAANEMNQRFQIPAEWQYGFLLNIIGKRKRFSKWIKKVPATKTVELIKQVYGYSDRRALECAEILSEDQISHLEQALYKGGRET